MILRHKSLLLAGVFVLGLMGAQSAFADTTVTVPTPNVVGNSDKWVCTATTGYKNSSWKGDRRDHYDDARNSALRKCQRNARYPDRCKVERGDCHKGY